MKKLHIHPFDSFPPRKRTLFYLLITKNIMQAFSAKLRPSRMPIDSELSRFYKRLEAEQKLIESYRKPSLLN